MSQRENQTSAPLSTRELLIGTPYRYLAPLGEGAMGQVVEAEQIALRRRVVIKLLRAEHAQRADLIDRLRLEAQAIAAIAPLTPHVVSVLDLGFTPTGRPYLVMERLEGRTLKEELRARGLLPVPEAVALTRQILGGLAAAHDAGILHRDIKPDNVFLCDAGPGARLVKLLDFGLAKVLAVAAPGGPAPLAQPTKEGTSPGTPRYFAPEQACGHRVGPPADLYSTAAVLYTMLTGRDPFAHRHGLLDVIQAQLSETPRPPSTLAAQPVPPALDNVVLRALAKSPEARFRSARELDAALVEAVWPVPQRRWAEIEPVDAPTVRVATAAKLGVRAARPASRAARRTAVLASVAVILLCLGASLVALRWVATPPRALPPPPSGLAK